MPSVDPGPLRAVEEAIDALGPADRSLVERMVEKKQKQRDRELRGGEEKQGISAAAGAGVGGLPDGQFPAKEWIVMDLGNRPPATWVDPWRRGGGLWRLHVRGLVKEEKEVRLRTLKKLGVRAYECDWHCVTGWSYRGVRLMGVPLDDFIHEICQPKAGWTSIMQVCADGYTCNVLKEDALGTGAFIALEDKNGDIISKDHGGIRIVFPQLYGWKSAKFLSELRFESTPTLGFWEKCGCHIRGRWAHNERWAPESRAVWEVLAFLTGQYRVWFGYGIWVKVMTYGGLALGGIVNLAKMIFPSLSGTKLIAAGEGTAAKRVEGDDADDQEEGGGLKFGGGPAMFSTAYTYEVGGWGWAVTDAKDGECVFVDERKGAQRSGRGVLDCSPVGGEACPQNKSRVVFTDGSSVLVDTSTLTPVARGHKVVSVASTAEFHMMARSQIGAGDRVLEIGCDFGGATRLMSAADDVVAVDKSAEHVAQAAEQHGCSNISFHVLDALCDVEGLKRLGAGRNKVFIDINGNRALGAVVRCVSLVQRLLGPDVIVVKSVALTDRLQKAG